MIKLNYQRKIKAESHNYVEQLRDMTLQLCRFATVAVSILMAAVSGQVTTSGQSNCNIEELAIVCETRLPIIIPENITTVKVKDFQNASVENQTFRHISWKNVSVLDITVNLHVNYRLLDYNFFPLKNLKTLGIHSPGLTMGINKHILYGLEKLEELNMTSCYRLQTRDLSTLLNDKVSLDALILDQTSLYESRQLVMDNSFFVLISKMKLRTVSLSGCNLVFDGVFNFNNLTFYWHNANFSNTTIIIRNKHDISTYLNLAKLTVNFKMLDHSYISERFWGINYTDLTWCSLSFNNLEYLYGNHIFSRSIVVNNSFLDLSECKLYRSLRVLHLSSNMIHYFNRTTIWPNTTRLFELDLSFNDMNYLSPNAYGSITTLETILLRHNNLSFMAQFIEFKNLFVRLSRLQHLDLSNNNLNWLPFEMFIKNYNLEILDLSGNKLKTVAFKIDHLRNLKYFNMENNKILYIDGVFLTRLVKLSANLNTTARISFYGNPLICSCDSKEFIEWLYSYVNTNNLKQYECSFDNKRVPIDMSAIDRSKLMCIQSEIVISGIGIVSITSFVTFFLVLWNKRKKRQQSQINFTKEFKHGALPQKFLCFFSFSSEDEYVCLNEIKTNLELKLRKLIGTKAEMVCVGDRHFNLGFPVVDEFSRCLIESCVVVFMVSNNFCESHWCRTELRVAYDANKPIILICKDDTDERRMTPLMLNIFSNNARAKLVQNDAGDYEMIPSYDHISKSILRLASVNFDKDDRV